MLAITKFSPVAIGGIGGSGTRLIAKILKKLGLYIGDDINTANDNLWFTLLFKHQEAWDMAEDQFFELFQIFESTMTGRRWLSQRELSLVERLSQVSRETHPLDWLRRRAQSLKSRVEHRHTIETRWGWKEPNTHIFLDKLIRSSPELKYIHVVRNGLDMAFSSNQYQLRFWGHRILGENIQVNPWYSLRFWHLVHNRVNEIGRQMGPRFMMLNYDEFCRSPTNWIERLASFVNIGYARLDRLASMVIPPGSIGRYRKEDVSIFDPRDVEFVREMGFDTD